MRRAWDNGRDPATGVAFVIRDVTARDFEAVGALNVEVYVGEEFSPPSATAALLAVGERAATNTTIVAADNTTGEIVGAVCIAYRSDLAQIAQPNEAEIRLLAVSPRARGKGAGRALVRECASRARAMGAKALVLSTQPSMSAAHRLYAREGFVREPTRDWQTPDGRAMLAHVLPL